MKPDPHDNAPFDKKTIVPIVPLDPKQWELYLSKYNKLMVVISSQISGDCGTLTSLEENLQDLYLTSIIAINSYRKKFPTETFEDLIQTTNFSKYIKSCLWNCKNKKGALITKKSNLYKNKISLDEYYSTGDD